MPTSSAAQSRPLRSRAPLPLSSLSSHIRAACWTLPTALSRSPRCRRSWRCSRRRAWSTPSCSDSNGRSRALGRRSSSKCSARGWTSSTGSSASTLPSATSAEATPSGGTQLRVEAVLLGFEGELYQDRLGLRFIRYLHPDIRFDSPPELVVQRKRDVTDTRRIVQQ